MMTLFRQERCAPWAPTRCHADFTSRERQNCLAQHDNVMKNIKMLTLAEELQPLLTRMTVMPESWWSDYYLLLQHHYHVYSADNRQYENLCILQHILYHIIHTNEELSPWHSPYWLVKDKYYAQQRCVGG